jgi:hypothetical protein
MFPSLTGLTIDLTSAADSCVIYSCSLYVPLAIELMTGHGASGLEGEWLFKASLVDLTTKIVVVRPTS